MVVATEWLALDRVRAPTRHSATNQSAVRVEWAETEQTTETKSRPSSATEEVDEGDVVRVDTQLVSIPAVVTDSMGHPVAGLRLENFLISKTESRRRLLTSATTENAVRNRAAARHIGVDA